MTQPGETIGSYVVEALLAEGGMGVVYKARNRVTGQIRALKVIKGDLSRNPDFVNRFVREATIASQVKHPYLVETLEPGIDGDVIYLPMELLEGETLHARVRRERRLEPEVVATILGPVCQAVQALHDQGLVHRDLKPMNVFLHRTARGEIPKVLDFGTARDVGDDEHTKTGMVVGSPYYMAPEQAEGSRDIDARADQYAVGVMAYQMLTGSRPYESDDTRSALAKLLRGDPYRPPRSLNASITEPMEQVIVRALSRARESRYDKIAELGTALVAAASAPAVALASGAGGFVPSAPASEVPSGVSGVRSAYTPEVAPIAPSPQPPRPGVPMVAIVGALAALGLVSAAIAFLVLPREPRPVITTELHPTSLPTVPTPPAIATPPALPPAAIVPPPTVDVVGAVAPDVAPVEPPAVAEDEDTAPSTSTGRRRRRTGGGSTTTTSTTSSGGSSRPPPDDDDAPCGASTGIPCLD